MWNSECFSVAYVPWHGLPWPCHFLCGSGLDGCLGVATLGLLVWPARVLPAWAQPTRAGHGLGGSTLFGIAIRECGLQEHGHCVWAYWNLIFGYSCSIGLKAFSVLILLKGVPIFQTFWKTDSCTDSLLDYKIKKHQTGTLIKCLISMLSNIAEILQGYKKIMN